MDANKGRTNSNLDLWDRNSAHSHNEHQHNKTQHIYYDSHLQRQDWQALTMQPETNQYLASVSGLFFLSFVNFFSFSLLFCFFFSLATENWVLVGAFHTLIASWVLYWVIYQIKSKMF